MGDIAIYPPGGALSSTLGYAEVTASQVFTAGVDLTGLSVTVTVPAGRRLQISAAGIFQNTAAGNRTLFAINEGAAALRTAAITHVTANVNETLETSIVISPTAGTHTYKLVGAATAGTSTLSTGAGQPGYILVEDITGTVWPIGGPVTAGMVASEAWTDYTPTLTQSATVTKTVTYARYQRLGRTIHFAMKLAVTGAGTAANPVRIGLPVVCSQTTDYTMGQGYIFDASTSTLHRALITPADGDEVFMSPTDGTVSNVLGATGFTAGLASSDVVVLAGTYEAAS